MYDAEISRSNPTAYIFLIDQSGSMQEPMVSGSYKSQFVADVINRTLRDLVVRCTREEGVRDYFHVGVIGYGDTSVRNALGGALGQNWLNPISAIADNTRRIEERPRKIDDGAGGITTQNVRFPVWVDPVNSGGTPMVAALAHCADIVATWSDDFPDSFPATVLHITDGAATDGDPEPVADFLQSQVRTSNGSTLMYNIHVSSTAATAIRYPADEDDLPDEYAQMLFRMSSTFPEHIRRYASDAYGLSIDRDSRAMVLNADAEELVKFLDIGSRPAAMR